MNEKNVLAEELAKPRYNYEQQGIRLDTAKGETDC